MQNYTIELSQEELDLLRKRITVCGCLDKLTEAKPGLLELSEIELEELLDAVAGELEESDEEEAELDALCEKLEAVVE